MTTPETTLDADRPLSVPVIHPAKSNRAPLIEVKHLDLWYGEKQALMDVSFDLYPGEILAFIGPSGCGKSTALKCLNRMHDDTRDVHMRGVIEMDGADIQAPSIDPPQHRRRFGWVVAEVDRLQALGLLLFLRRLFFLRFLLLRLFKLR